MKIIEQKQNSKSWRAWRDTGIGASDAPIIMEESPYGTAFQLWAQKCGLMERPEPNVYTLKAMERGHKLEPEARALYEQQVGAKFSPICIEHDEYPYLRASLDGYNSDLQYGIEIKAASKADHAGACNSKVPAKYRAQIQMQMLIAGAPKWMYVSYHPDEAQQLAVVEVAADELYQLNLETQAKAFWKHVQERTPPAVNQEEVVDTIYRVIKQMEVLTKAKELLTLILDSYKEHL
jgi:putative phage-type endonuclease